MQAAHATNRRNNFDCIRLVAALAVLWDHQHALMGLPGPVLLDGSYGGLAVAAFFAISGYLVTKSWFADPNALRFVWRRCLRSWPALTVVVLLSVLVLGPLLTPLSLRTYFLSPMTWAYFKTLYLDVQFQLPGVFASFSWPAVNGSLWTIPLEVACYAALLAAGVLGLTRYRFISVILIAVMVAYTAYRYRPSAMPVAWSHGLQYGSVFVIGVVFASYEAHWRNRPWRAALVCIAVLGVLYAANTITRSQVPVWGLACAAVLVGAASWPVLRDVGRWGDISYGTYIYAFPVQQTVLWVLKPWQPNFALAVCMSLIVTLLLAACSWHWVEQPALRFKPKRPT